MNALPSTSEIVESIDVEYEKKVREKAGKNVIVESENKYTIDDEINQLFEAINVRTPSRGFGSSNEINRDSLRKSAMKRPIRVSSAQASGIGISEPVNLKQALRGLCISHASEMAAMKRLSRPTASPGGSDSGTIKRLYRRVAAEDDGNDIAQKEPKGNLVEISLVPEKISLDHAVNISEDRISHPLHPLADATEQPSECRTAAPLVNNPEADPMVGTRGLKSGAPSKSNNLKDVLEGGIYSNDLDIVPANSILPDDAFKSEFHPGPSQSGLSTACRISKPSGKSPLMKPIFRNKSFIKKKAKQDPTSTHFSSPSSSEKIVDDSALCTSDRDSQVQKCGQQNEMKGKESASAESSSHKVSIEVNSSIMNTHSNKTQLSASGSNRNKLIFTDLDEKSSSKGKGEFSQSSKSSIGDYSSSTSISEESYSSGSFCSGNRHHMSKDLRWKAIRSVQKQFGALGLSQFKLLKRLGCGDIGTVYLAELTGTSCLFALKLMENEFLVSRKKLPRAQTEREILQMLDHPFLPTLYAHFATDKLSCLVMEYCPGGDLHVLRQKQPSRSLSEQAARFYVAEVLLALEYLHMLGVVYRDLKPENILVREDGHIMLTDFDLSLRCAANPMLVKSTSPAVEPAKHVSSSCTEASCINPFCLHPSWQVSCFTPRLLAVATKSRKMKSDLSSQISPLPELVVEPTGARSNSFVGTHEYLAPEIIKGDGHGSAVDWWTFGIFLFELLYGRTPFKGSGNEETLANVVSQSLRFPSSPIVSFHARDLIRGLLVKEPESRLGSVKGAAEIKQHPFFEGLNWALIRCAKPPELPKLFDFGIPATSQKNESKKYEEFKSIDEDTEFEMF